MKYISGFFAFWYDFLIGDAWEVAAGVVICLLVLGGGVAVLGSGVATYGAFLFPLAVVGLLGFSLWRVRGSA